MRRLLLGSVHAALILLQVGLAVRGILNSVSASRDVAWVDFIYRITDPVINIFSQVVTQDFEIFGSKVDLITIVAFLVLGVLAWGVREINKGYSD